MHARRGGIATALRPSGPRGPRGRTATGAPPKSPGADCGKRFARPAGTIRARVEESEGHLAVSIADDGPGIPAEDLPRVFDLFYRGDPARTGGQGEAGLGLAICKRLVQRHGGVIRAENRAGATIVFTLPLS